MKLINCYQKKKNFFLQDFYFKFSFYIIKNKKIEQFCISFEHPLKSSEFKYFNIRKILNFVVIKFYIKRTCKRTHAMTYFYKKNILFFKLFTCLNLTSRLISMKLESIDYKQVLWLLKFQTLLNNV